MNKGLLILISAPSGAGKTSLVAAALPQDPQLVLSVSHTTRTQRATEVDGVDYNFVDASVFNQMIEAGDFLEHAQVFGNLYGTGCANVQAQQALGQDVVLEIDWQGAEQIRQLVPEAVSVFILPPSEEALAQRLNQRGQDSQQSIENRLAEARLDMSKATAYDYIIINDSFEQALQDLLAVIRGARHTTARQITYNPIVQQMVLNLKDG